MYSEVIAQSDSNVQGVAIKGIEPEIAAKTQLARYVSKDEGLTWVRDEEIILHRHK